jgi:subtilisin family serine protease
VKARTSLAAAGALAALAVASPHALGAGLRNAPAPPRVSLPGDVTASAARTDPDTWIVGVRAGGGALARAHGGERVAGRAFLVPRERANALAAALRSRWLLDYAEPNRLASRAQAPAPDPLSGFARWRDFVVGDAVPPPVTGDSPLIGLVDTPIDESHPEIAGSNISTSGGRLTDLHGTATSTVAAAPANGVGFLGIWPDARALNVPLPDGRRIACSDSASAIADALRAGSDVINMSYGSPTKCIAEEQQILRAIKAGAVPVAAAGNEFQQGNPLEFPASLAHVITVGAIGPDDRPTGFSNESGALDLSAPGVGIFTAVPKAFDRDGTPDGFALLDGTSFAAPMVSAAVAWVRAARPELTPYQAAQVVRLGARDIGAKGYENATGFGAVILPGARARRAPAEDPQEPNDDIRYVNGRAFRSATPPLYAGSAASVAATADYAEDPVDVYRVKIPAGRRVRLSLSPAVGDPDLFVFGASARSVRKSRSLRSSSKQGDATERLTVRNRGRRTRTVYVAVGFDARKKVKLYNASYRLRAR